MINIHWNKLQKNYLTYNIDAWKVIGGKAWYNHTSNPENFSNSCAIRVSHALNLSGAEIPYSKGKTISGDNKSWYYYRVKDLLEYLQGRYGYADFKTSNKNMVLNSKGIICFDINVWTDATGHFTLFDGNKALGGEHDSDFYFKTASQFLLWKAE